MGTTPFKLWADLTKRGFHIRLMDGRPAVSPRSKLTAEDRQALASWGNDLATLLSLAESWDVVEVRRLAYDADTLVFDLNVSDQHPEIQEAIEEVFLARDTQNMTLVRAAHTELALVVRRLAARKDARRPQGVIQTPSI